MSSQNPLSAVQGQSNPAAEKSSSALDESSVPRSAVGVVNDAGDIISKDGKAIGRVAESKDLQSLAGNTVTAAGDVLNSTGDIVGKVADDNYTTQNQDGGKASGGFFSGAKGVLNTVGSLGKPVTDGVGGLLSRGRKSETQSNTDTPAEDEAQTDVGSQAPLDAQSERPDDLVSQGQTTEAQDLPEDSVSQVQDLGDDAASQAQQTDAQTLPDDQDVQTQGDLQEQEPIRIEDQEQEQDLPLDGADNNDEGGDDEKSKAGDKLEGASELAPSQIGDKAEDATSQAPNASEVAPSQAGDQLEEGSQVPDAPEVSPSQAGDKLEEGSQVPDTSEVSPSQAGDKLEEGSQVPDVTPSQAGEDAGEAAGEATDKVEEVAGEEKPGEDAGEVAGEAADKAEEVAGEEKPGEEELEKVEEEVPKVDLSALKGTKVNKAGNLVNDNGDIIGRLVDGDPKHLQGKRCDEEGNIWDDSGKIVGKAELIPDSETDKKAFAPFENFPDAVVEADGRVVSNGQQVGTVVEGDPKRLKGSRVDEDGDILDRRGNVVGKAEAWDEPEPVPEEPEAVVDRSLLAGKRVNKAGNVVDSSGTIWGKVIEGNPANMVGRMCDKEGNVRSEAGDIIGKAELVPEGEREGSKEGPFTDLPGCTVAKDGKVVTAAGDVVGRLVKGDPKILFGRSVDDDGDILDRNGNSIGKAERWDEPEPEERKKGPMEGRKVNRDGNVLSDEGSVIGKLVSGEILVCAGKEIDADGDVINSKGNTVGHVALLEDIPEEVGESAEEKEAREQAEKDRKLAQQLASCIEGSLDKIKPILRMITDKIDRAERTPKEELDEDELVKQVKPLIEEGGRILTETNGVIRGLDPDGRIQRNAKHKSGTKEASPEEYHLADVLKELTGTVTETIDNAKRKIEEMPKAKKELNPLWGLLSDPLFQILAAVGLLLNGVLGLVGKLLQGLGLGALVDNILGGLGINKLLGTLGLGSAYDALTGKNKKKDEKK